MSPVDSMVPDANLSSSPPAPDTASNGDVGAGAKVLRRACDCCRKRKVRCDGGDPCGPCKKATIRCAYLQPPKKKGPKGLRSARVLHALRRIDDSASGSPTSPLSPDQPFGNWGWQQQNGSSHNMHYPPSMGSHPTSAGYGPQPSVSPDHSYFQPMSTSVPPPQPQPTAHPQTYGPEPQSWPRPPESISTSSDIHSLRSPVTPENFQHSRLPSENFIPYVRLFFNHMFPIMPVIDHNIYLDPSFYANSNLWNPDVYCFLCALCAATIVQLDTSIPQPPPLHPSKATDHVFADECLRERKRYDYIEPTSTLSVMTSFFLFCYCGNHEKHAKAWHYLQESITFSENLNMDDEASYNKLDPVEAQWRRRLYWLLFITERAYAVQRRKHTRLTPSVQLPAVFESEDPTLLNGFVNLANLFAAVDDNFVRAWRGSRRQSLCNEAWLAETQKQLDAAALALDNVSETQHLDISVTREWLHVLAWQMGVSNGLIWGKGEGGMRLDYPIELARKVVEITTGANAQALDSHGIGMEQKLSDIAGCLADVLRCTAGDTSPAFIEGKQYLNILLQQLSSMRGKESRYLKPLMAKMEGLVGYELSNQTLPLPTKTPSTSAPVPAIGLGMQPTYTDHLRNGTGRLSMADSVGMLRTLSMSGSLGMPSLAVSMEDWTQRRPSGRVYDEDETEQGIGNPGEGWSFAGASGGGGGIAQTA